MAVRKINLAVFISGRGSNLQALIDSCAKSDFPAKIVVVISNIPDVMGLERAKKAGIQTETVPSKGLSREVFEENLLKVLGNYKIDLVCLAGFMRILTPKFIDMWPERLINIHPSLLPDYKGLHTHERAIADGKTMAGCTIHYVVPEMDSGPIIVQHRVQIWPEDTPETLAARVLEQEHIAYPEAVRIVAAKLKAGNPVHDFTRWTSYAFKDLFGMTFLDSEGKDEERGPVSPFIKWVAFIVAAIVMVIIYVLINSIFL